MGLSVLPLWLLLPGLCAGNSLLPSRAFVLQSGLEGLALERRPLSLELLEEAGNLPLLLGSGFLGDLVELEPECRELLSAFANSSVRLTGCFVRSARPVRLCQNCYRQYREVTEQLQNITGTVKVRVCIFLKRDRPQWSRWATIRSPRLDRERTWDLGVLLCRLWSASCQFV